MLHYQEAIDGDKKFVEQLCSLLQFYGQSNSLNSQISYTHVISTSEDEEITEVKMVASTKAKPKFLEENERISPDGKRKLTVTRWSDGKHASTYVLITFPSVSGAIYALNGILDGINAYWQDNQNVIIETRKNYESNTKNQKVSNFDDVIKIHYVEK